MVHSHNDELCRRQNLCRDLGNLSLQWGQMGRTRNSTQEDLPRNQRCLEQKDGGVCWALVDTKELKGPLTCGLLCEHDFGLGREVLSRENHLLAPVDQAAVDILSLHHGQLVGGSLGCGQEDEKPL